MNPSNNAPRFVCNFRVAGTKSFRLAAGKLFDEYGGNSQNPSKGLLSILTARPGCSFIQPDQAGAEALIVAHLTRPGNYRALFANGIKPHSFLALHIFGANKPAWFEGLPLPRDAYLSATDPAALAALPGWKELAARIAASDSEPDRPYYSGKRTAHARSYRMGWRTFQEAILKDTAGALVLSVPESKHYLSMFDTLFPEVIEWQGEVVLTAQSAGLLRNLFGFPRRCTQIFTHGYENELISWIPQSTVGCITHEGVRKFRRDREARPTMYRQWRLLNNKHDSLLLEVPDADIPDAAPYAKTLMAVDLVGRDGIQFKMKSDVQVGKVWAPEKMAVGGMKEYKV